MISLGQIALLTIGCWIGTRLAYATSLPFPLLLLRGRSDHVRRSARSSGCRRCGSPASTSR